MPRYSAIRLAEDPRARLIEEFYRTVAAMRSAEEMRDLFDDLCSPTETIMLMRRIHIAYLLLHGEGYKDIKRCLRASETTIKTVQAKLARKGSGYRKAADRLKVILPEMQEEVSAAIESLDPYSSEALKRKYAGYYLLDFALREAPRSIRETAAGYKRKKTL